jgi:hypothetical protein
VSVPSVHGVTPEHQDILNSLRATLVSLRYETGCVIVALWHMCAAHCGPRNAGTARDQPPLHVRNSWYKHSPLLSAKPLKPSMREPFL